MPSPLAASFPPIACLFASQHSCHPSRPCLNFGAPPFANRASLPPTSHGSPLMACMAATAHGAIPYTRQRRGPWPRQPLALPPLHALCPPLAGQSRAVPGWHAAPSPPRQLYAPMASCGDCTFSRHHPLTPTQFPRQQALTRDTRWPKLHHLPAMPTPTTACPCPSGRASSPGSYPKSLWIFSHDALAASQNLSMRRPSIPQRDSSCSQPCRGAWASGAKTSTCRRDSARRLRQRHALTPCADATGHASLVEAQTLLLRPQAPMLQRQ
jgi:hypothetical protein